MQPRQQRPLIDVSFSRYSDDFSIFCTILTSYIVSRRFAEQVAFWKKSETNSSAPFNPMHPIFHTLRSACERWERHELMCARSGASLFPII